MASVTICDVTSHFSLGLLLSGADVPSFITKPLFPSLESNYLVMGLGILHVYLDDYLSPGLFHSLQYV